MLHHDSEEFDDDFGAGPNEYLTLSTLLRIINALQGIRQCIH